MFFGIEKPASGRGEGRRTVRRKIATVHKKESFKAHGRRRCRLSAILRSSWFGGGGGYPSTSPEPPLQFFIRPETLRHMVVRAPSPQPLCVACVSDFNTNKRFELIYRPAVSHPLHTHTHTHVGSKVCHKFIGSRGKHVTIIYTYIYLYSAGVSW